VNEKRWWERPWGIVALGVLVTVVGGLVLWLITRHYDRPTASIAIEDSTKAPLLGDHDAAQSTPGTTSQGANPAQPSVTPEPKRHHQPKPTGPSTPAQPQPGPPMSQECAPGSACPMSNGQQGGVTAGIYVATPEPKISFVVDSDPPPLPPDITFLHPHVCVRISVDRLMDSPKFAVVCDRSCNAKRGTPIMPHEGVMGGDQWGTIPDHPEVAAFVVGQPNPMPSSVQYSACVESSDDKPITVVSVQKLTITGAQSTEEKSAK
jgi:hypothetical protein